MTKKLTIVAVDDHPLNHVAIKSLLDERQDMVLVGQGAVGEDVLPLVDALRPDVLILDLSMPQKAGRMSDAERFMPLPTLTALREQYPDTAVIILSQYLHRGIIQEAVQQGVRGYLLKSDDLSLNLTEAIAEVSRGGVFFSVEISREIFQATRTRRPDPLTDRQMEIILAIASAPDAAYAQVAASLHITESTLKGHLSNAFRALGVTNFTACLIVCMQQDLISLSRDISGTRFDRKTLSDPY